MLNGSKSAGPCIVGFALFGALLSLWQVFVAAALMLAQAAAPSSQWVSWRFRFFVPHQHPPLSRSSPIGPDRANSERSAGCWVNCWIKIIPQDQRLSLRAH